MNRNAIIAHEYLLSALVKCEMSQHNEEFKKDLSFLIEDEDRSSFNDELSNDIYNIILKHFKYNTTLDELRTNDFSGHHIFTSNPNAIRDIINRSDIVDAMVVNVMHGYTSIVDIERMVKSVLEDFKPGVVFGNQEVLIAVAIIYSRVILSLFKYIDRLATFTCSEMVRTRSVSKSIRDDLFNKIKDSICQTKDMCSS